MPDKEEDALTPGGTRPKSAVHRVEPGQTVTGAGEIESSMPPERHPDAAPRPEPDEMPGSQGPEETPAEMHPPAVQPDARPHDMPTQEGPAGDEPPGMHAGSPPPEVQPGEAPMMTEA